MLSALRSNSTDVCGRRLRRHASNRTIVLWSLIDTARRIVATVPDQIAVHVSLIGNGRLA